jgi:hypothetical protein
MYVREITEKGFLKSIYAQIKLRNKKDFKKKKIIRKGKDPKKKRT